MKKHFIYLLIGCALISGCHYRTTNNIETIETPPAHAKAAPKTNRSVSYNSSQISAFEATPIVYTQPTNTFCCPEQPKVFYTIPSVYCSSCAPVYSTSYITSSVITCVPTAGNICINI